MNELILLSNTLLPTWQVVLYNAIGVISIFLQIMIFQMKQRKNIIIVSILSNLGWITYFALQNDIISGVSGMVTILSNLIFIFRGKYRWASSKLWLIFFLAVAGSISAFTFKAWNDIFPLLGALASIFAFFMIKEQNIRLVSLVTYAMFMCNSISKLYIVALIADVTAFLSALIAFIRFARQTRAKVTDTGSDN